MNRTIKDASVKRYHYDSRAQLRAHLQLFVDAYQYARRLNILRGLTPYQHVVQVGTKEPERVRVDPPHHSPALYMPGLPPPRGSPSWCSTESSESLALVLHNRRCSVFVCQPDQADDVHGRYDGPEAHFHGTALPDPPLSAVRLVTIADT